MRRHGTGGVLATALAAALLVACGSSTERSATTSTAAAQKTPSKLPAAVAQTVVRLKAGEKPGGSTFADSGVPVRDDGKLQLELHAAGPITDAQKADLTGLGSDIVAAGTEVGIIDAWVPFARVDDAAGLHWVASVTVPSPTRGH